LEAFKHNTVFKGKQKMFYAFWLFTRQHKLQLASKGKFLKSILQSSLCKLQKCESVKTVTACTCHAYCV